MTKSLGMNGEGRLQNAAYFGSQIEWIRLSVE
jgi:hypothetical protein